MVIGPPSLLNNRGAVGSQIFLHPAKEGKIKIFGEKNDQDARIA